MTRRQLRATLDARRRMVPPSERAAASRRVARHADRALHLAAGMRLALYAARTHELDSAPLIELARSRGCHVYLPRIDRARRARGMQFVALGAALRSNRLGIGEPERGATIGARWLDVIFLPLTGFDACGVRLGSGGGYYDRALAFRHSRQAWHAPRLVGLAYAFQEVAHLERAPHDVLMDAVITEAGLIRCATG